MPAGNPGAYLTGGFGGGQGNPFGGGAQGIADILPLLIQLQAVQGLGGRPDAGGPQSMNGGGLRGGPSAHIDMMPGPRSMHGGGLTSGPSPQIQMQPPGMGGPPPQSMHGNPVPQPGMGGPPPVQRGQAPVYMQPRTQDLPWVQNGQMQAPAYASGLAQRLALQRQGRVARPGSPPFNPGGGTPSGGGGPRPTPRPRGPQDWEQKPQGGGSPPFYPGGNAQSIKGSRR